MALGVAVLAAGGTITSRTDGSGTATAQAGRRNPLGNLPLPAGVAVDAEDVSRLSSHATPLQQPVVRVHDGDAGPAASTEHGDPPTRPLHRPPVATTGG